MKNYYNNKSKSRMSKKNLYLAIFFVVVSTLLIVVISIKRSFNASTNGPELSQNPSSAAVPTNEFKQGVEKPGSTENTSSSQKPPEEASGSKTEKKPVTKTSSAEPEKQAPARKTAAAQFVKPIEDGSLLQEFSHDNLVYSSSVAAFKTHNGIDIKAKANTPVKSVCDGEVVAVFDYDTQWGQCVEIKHSSGVVFVYKGLDKTLQVKPNTKVKAGTTIGCVGETFLAEGALEQHLHLEVKKGDEFIDPLKYVKYEK